MNKKNKDLHTIKKLKSVINTKVETEYIKNLYYENELYQNVACSNCKHNDFGQCILHNENKLTGCEIRINNCYPNLLQYLETYYEN